MGRRDDISASPGFSLATFQIFVGELEADAFSAPPAEVAGIHDACGADSWGDVIIGRIELRYVGELIEQFEVFIPGQYAFLQKPYG
jgi:hypothetical protein